MGEITKTTLKPIPLPSSGELSEVVYRKCFFCEKDCEVTQDYSCLADEFHCNFCLRHGLHTRGNRDILILSFRAILGHFYHHNHLNLSQSPDRMWLSEIEDFIESHRRAGEANPLFLYDPETYLWFVNFAKVGTSQKKLPVESILKTVLSILATFNLWSTTSVSMCQLFQNYRDAIEVFYHKRSRPEGRRMLIPSLVGGMKAKNFVASTISSKKY